METVELDGVRYVKASVAAKKFRYTQDYIGQLCRGKKVDARLVGRTWFVNTDSIIEHKNNKYKTKKTVAPVEAKVAVTVEEDGSASKLVPVEPVITNKAVKSLKRSKKPKIHATPEGQRMLTIEYSVDDESLIPTLKKRVERAPKSLQVKVANAKTVRVRSERKKVAFKAGDLPEVSLKGVLKIEDYPEIPEPAEEEKPKKELIEEGSKVENKPKNKDISEERDKKTVSVKETAGSRSKKVKLKKLDVALQEKETEKIAEEKPQTLDVPVSNIPTQPVRRKTAVLASEVPSFHPRSVRTPENSVEVSLLVSISPLVATIVALGCVLLLFSASAQVVTNDLASSSKVVFQKANLLDVLAP